MERAPLDTVALQAALGGRWPRIAVVEDVDSTNAMLLADEDAPDRTLLAAEHQVAGRGRLDRTWSSPARAGLTFSVLLRPEAPVDTWGWLPLLTGLAARDALATATGVDVALKWPNDLLARPSEKKLAGILAQTTGPAVVIGIGLNVSTTEDELPVDTATSLALEGASDLDRTRLLVAIAREFDERVEHWTRARGDAEACGLLADYTAACLTLGRDVTVSTTAGPALEGRAVGIDPDGRLQLERNGRITAIGAGDVEHLRPRP
jgi:BirA family biotin operon repressor/biotin-[acetyl-CoA-carboxylase] ligase